MATATHGTVDTISLLGARAASCCCLLLPEKPSEGKLVSLLRQLLCCAGGHAPRRAWTQKSFVKVWSAGRNAALTALTLPSIIWDREHHRGHHHHHGQ